MSIFRDDALASKVALVTGGGSGIGKGIVRAFMQHGADVGIVGRKQERLETAAKELSEATGRRCLALAGDVRDYAALEGIVDRLLGELGRLDILVNAAAGNFLCPAAQLSANGFGTVLDIDAKGTFNMSRVAFAKWLSEHGGNIINISATLHYGATPMQVHAAAAKAAVDAVTRTLAVEWGPAGIRVNGIAPGPIDETEGVAKLLPEGMRKKVEGAIPLRRFGRIEEIANVALFLASDAASLVTGATWVADGGAWLPDAGAAMMLQAASSS